MSKKTVEAGEIVDGLEILRMDPNDLQLDQNVRKNVRLTDEFLSSIRTLGVQAPVLAYRDLLGQVLVVDGQRRVQAARQEGLASVPVMISQAPGSPEHTVLRQVALNEARTSLLTSELTDAAWQLSLFGMEPESIAAQIGRKPAEVRHLLRVAEAGATRVVVREVPELTIPQAAALAELEDNEAVDDERFDRVVDDIAADPDQADHILSRARLDAQVESAFRAVERKWKAEGVRTVRHGSPEWKEIVHDALPFSRLVVKKTGEKLSDAEMLAHEGLVISLLSPSEASGDVTEAWYCLDHVKHGLCRDWEVPTSTSWDREEKSEEQRQAEAEKRRRVIESNKASDAAKEVRLEFLKTLVVRGMKDVDRLAVESYFRRGEGVSGEWNMASPNSLIDEAGLLPTNVTLRGWAAASPKNAQRTLLASVLGTFESLMMRDFWRRARSVKVDRGDFAKPEVPREVWYLRLLEANGYTLAPIEREYCEACETLVEQKRAEIEAQGAVAKAVR